MMYQNKLVAAVKVNGKILRELEDTVAIPFGSEYSILLKNLNSVRVQVKVSVDGKDATEGTWLIVEPNSKLELERFIKGRNLDSGNKFKFIERTTEIEEHRGIKEDDSLIRIEYKTEKKPTIVDETIVRKHYVYDYEYWSPFGYYPYYYSSPCWNTGVIMWNTTRPSTTDYAGDSVTLNCTTSSLGSAQGSSHGSPLRAMAMNCSAPVNDVGITVPGTKSDQRFRATSGFSVHEQSQVIVIKLRGEVKGKAVATPVTVDTKLTCETCGKKSKSSEKFCSNCGTSLEIV